MASVSDSEYCFIWHSLESYCNFLCVKVKTYKFHACTFILDIYTKSRSIGIRHIQIKYFNKFHYCEKTGAFHITWRVTPCSNWDCLYLPGGVRGKIKNFFKKRFSFEFWKSFDEKSKAYYNYLSRAWFWLNLLF